MWYSKYRDEAAVCVDSLFGTINDVNYAGMSLLK